VSKVCGLSMARSATQIMLGKSLGDLGLEHRDVSHFGVKEAVFPFYFYPEVDPVLGPEMRSTGEVLGLADSYGMAFYKAQDGAKATLPTEGTVLLSLCARDRDEHAARAAKCFADMGFKLVASAGTHAFLAEHGISSTCIRKVHEGRPNIDDAIKNGDIQLVVNTPSGKLSVSDDSYIRKSAIRYKVPHITTVTAALASAEGIKAKLEGETGVRALQDYHAS
jgi:carbamoyl-phosphate synthase large subunit